MYIYISYITGTFARSTTRTHGSILVAHAYVVCGSLLLYVRRPPAQKLWDNWMTGKGGCGVEARIAQGARSACWRRGAKMTLTDMHVYTYMYT